AYYKWVIGGARSKAAVDNSGDFFLSTQGIALLELLPDTRMDRYELLASLRHDKSDQPGEVGVYFSHRIHPHPERDIHFYMQCSFNSVAGPRIPTDLPGLPNAKAMIERLKQGSPSALVVRWGMEESVTPAEFGYRSSISQGPRIRPLGSFNGRWFKLRMR